MTAPKNTAPRRSAKPNRAAAVGRVRIDAGHAPVPADVAALLIRSEQIAAERDAAAAAVELIAAVGRAGDARGALHELVDGLRRVTAAETVAAGWVKHGRCEPRAVSGRPALKRHTDTARRFRAALEENCPSLRALPLAAEREGRPRRGGPAEPPRARRGRGRRGRSRGAADRFAGRRRAVRRGRAGRAGGVPVAGRGRAAEGRGGAARRRPGARPACPGRSAAAIRAGRPRGRRRAEIVGRGAGRRGGGGHAVRAGSPPAARGLHARPANPAGFPRPPSTG